MEFRYLIVILIFVSFFSCQKETAVTVSSIDFWTDTKVEVKAGQVITIEATGEVYGQYNPPAHIWGPLGPEGQTDEVADSLWMLPGAPKIVLIGKIGEEGKPFEVSREVDFSAENGGLLFLGVNDRVYLHPLDHHYVEKDSRQIHAGCYEDNKGEFTARIKVSNP